MDNDPIPSLTVDHVELFVPDRTEAAAWYARILGLRPSPGTERWAADPEGPLMLSGDGGVTKIALFRGQPQGPRRTAGWHRLAFRVDGQAFLAFLRHARAHNLRERGEPLRLSDHTDAFSLYFADPYGHRLEVTTYDHDIVRAGVQPTDLTLPGSPGA